MATFGKADVGLIKAVAGAEKSMLIDEDLMAGAAIGGLVDSLSKKAQVQAGVQKSIQKEIDEKFGTTSANLPDQFSQNLIEFVPGMKNQYASVGGSDILGKHKKSRILTNHDDYLLQVENLVGSIQANNEQLAVNGAGHNAKSLYYLDSIKAGNYQVFTAYDKDGKPSPNIAVPMKTEPRPDSFEFEYNGAKFTLADVLERGTFQGSPEEMEKFNNAVEKAQTAYNTARDSYDEWNSLEDKIDGRPNPAKYQTYNSKTLPSRESNKDNAAAELNIYNKNVSLLKGDSDHNNIAEAGTYSSQWANQVSGYSGLDLQHTLFTDASDDNVDNSYGNIFVNQTGNDPDMYKDSNGEPINLIVSDGKSIKYGDEDWEALEESEQKKLLEMHIRGEGADGRYNPDRNSDFHKKGYANFMGKVTRDAALIKQRNYFENKGMYFDNGDGNPVNSVEVQENRKQIAYTYHKFDAAFPERLLGTDGFNDQLTEEGNIGKALEAEFPDLDFDFEGEGILEVDNTTFDFSGANRKQELVRLKEYIHTNNQLSDTEASIAANMSNSVKDEDWKKMRRKNFNYHPQGQTTSDYLQFEGSTGNLVTGPLQVVGYDEDNKMYEVVDNNGVTHNIDEDTLYPEGI